MIFTVTLNPAIDRELVVPAIEFDTVLRATAARVDFGGKGFNVSRMLASLGAESVALGFAGGAAGEQLRDGLEALSIATDFTPSLAIRFVQSFNCSRFTEPPQVAPP